MSYSGATGINPESSTQLFPSAKKRQAQHALHRGAFGRRQLLGELLQARIVDHNAHNRFLKLIRFVSVLGIESTRHFRETFLAIALLFGIFPGHLR
jgi:hypothetical protein